MNLRYNLTLALLITCTNVLAEGYVGIGFGETDYDADEVSSFNNPNGTEFYVGFKSSENLGFEFGFVNFGEADDGVPPEWHLEADSLAFSLLGIAPTGSSSEVYFQFGLHMWDIDISEDGFGVFGKDDGNDIFYGFGFRTNVSETVALGIRYNNYDFDGDDVTRLSFHAQFGID